MKKLLFVLAFTFIGQPAFSQMYIVLVTECDDSHPSACNPNNYNYNAVMTTVDPLGNITYDCLLSPQVQYGGSQVAILNQKFNSILNQGYKLVSSDSNNNLTNSSSNEQHTKHY